MYRLQHNKRYHTQLYYALNRLLRLISMNICVVLSAKLFWKKESSMKEEALEKYVINKFLYLR